MRQKIEKIVHQQQVECFYNQCLSMYTTMQVGGKAEIILSPLTSIAMVELLESLKQNNIPYFILGKGSNLVINDKGIEIVVISTDKLNNISLDQNNELNITAESGVTLKDLSDFALKYSLTGFEFASGIPGTVGGAVFMNAGAYGGEMKDVVLSSQIWDPKQGVINITGKQHEFSYRYSSIAKHNQVVLSTIISLKKGNPEYIDQTIKELSLQRESKQPLEFASCGSVFKRPEGHFAGKLIMDAGLQGYSIGGAYVSEKHAGFIVNKGEATAQDIIALIEHIRSVVKDKFSVDLEPEVKLVEKDGSFKIWIKD